MDLEFYPFQADDDRLYFRFLSISPDRTIRKAVIFTPLSAHEVFNLALVDVRPDGSICDKTISNNGDLEKVMATVFQCVAQFFESYPRLISICRPILRPEIGYIGSSFQKNFQESKSIMKFMVRLIR